MLRDITKTNWCLQKHDLTPDVLDYEGWESESSDETTLRLRARTRAISWSPACHLFATRRCGESLLAAANDNSEILFFRFNLFLDLAFLLRHAEKIVLLTMCGGGTQGHA